MTNISTYDLQTASGRHIRKATQVRVNGETIRFTERLTKREATRAVELELARRADVTARS